MEPNPLDEKRRELQDISDAVGQVDGRTPKAVLDAFIPVAPVVFGRRLLPVTIGTLMALEKLEHPFAVPTQSSIGIFEIAGAFHVLTTPSAELFRAIQAGRIAGDIAEVVDFIAEFKIAEAMATMDRYVAGEMSAIVPMRSTSETPHKPGGFGWLLTAVTTSCAAFGWSIERAIHEVQIRQLFALNACNAWSNGLEPAGQTYEDRDLEAKIKEIRTKRKAK